MDTRLSLQRSILILISLGTSLPSVLFNRANIIDVKKPDLAYTVR